MSLTIKKILRTLFIVLICSLVIVLQGNNFINSGFVYFIFASVFILQFINTYISFNQPKDGLIISKTIINILNTAILAVIMFCVSVVTILLFPAVS